MKREATKKYKRHKANARQLAQSVLCLLVATYSYLRINLRLVFFRHANPSFILRLLNYLLRKLARNRIVMRELHVKLPRAAVIEFSVD